MNFMAMGRGVDGKYYVMCSGCGGMTKVPDEAVSGTAGEFWDWTRKNLGHRCRGRV